MWEFKLKAQSRKHKAFEVSLKVKAESTKP
jgi:hypothetical protein